MTASPAFIARTRNPKLVPPAKVERTVKQPGDVEIVSEAMQRWRARS